MIDRLFYIIYNSYYKHGKYQNDIPPLTVFGIFCMGLLSLIFTIFLCVYHLKDPYYFRHNPQPPGQGVIFIISIIITYFAFYYKKRYKEIYNKFKDISSYDTKHARFLAFSFMILLILSPLIEIYLVTVLIINA